MTNCGLAGFKTTRGTGWSGGKTCQQLALRSACQLVCDSKRVEKRLQVSRRSKALAVPQTTGQSAAEIASADPAMKIGNHCQTKSKPKQHLGGISDSGGMQANLHKVSGLSERSHPQWLFVCLKYGRMPKRDSIKRWQFRTQAPLTSSAKQCQSPEACFPAVTESNTKQTSGL